jgi:pyruvate dehydrogenase E2 component (dihydrolipoamide acetyltransferase)
MSHEFKLPDLGEGITEGEVRRWLVREGEMVAEHQTVVEVETDKAVVELPAPRAGRVVRIARLEGTVARVGEVLMIIAEPDEGPSFRQKSISVVGTLPEPEDEEVVLATPAVRRRAREMGVRLVDVAGSGPRGSVTLDDVEKAVTPARPVEDRHGGVERIPLRGVRRTIARNLVKAHLATAFVTCMGDADVSDLWDLRLREFSTLKEMGIHLTFFPFFIKAVQHALVEHPLLNAAVDEEREEIIVKKYCNIGIAVDTADGLMVPVVKDVVRKSILELATEIRLLGERARERKISLEEMQGSTFTITDFGPFGGTYATPIINYPDVAILGCGRIADKPWVKDKQIVIRKILPLSLTFDHRVTDGVYAAGFLSKVTRYLEDPTLIFLEST